MLLSRIQVATMTSVGSPLAFAYVLWNVKPAQKATAKSASDTKSKTKRGIGLCLRAWRFRVGGATAGPASGEASS